MASRRWKIGVLVAAAVAVGVGILVARVGNATSYLSDDAAACINCHVMTDAYASWQRGSHGHVAVCNDCHVPHSNLVATYAFKARDGGRHSVMFTFDLQPQVLRLSSGARPVVQANCVRCHTRAMMGVRLPGVEERACWDCHHGVHGEVGSLSASPPELRPALPPAGLPWSEKEPHP